MNSATVKPLFTEQWSHYSVVFFHEMLLLQNLTWGTAAKLMDPTSINYFFYLNQMAICVAGGNEHSFLWKISWNTETACLNWS
jgi:hypothetical protein